MSIQLNALAEVMTELVITLPEQPYTLEEFREWCEGVLL